MTGDMINDFDGIELSNYDQAIEERSKPLEGQYLATVLGVRKHIKESTGSVGLMWTLLINLNQNAIESGWNPNDRSMEWFKEHYTYVGKNSPNGFDTKGNFTTVNISEALTQGRNLRFDDCLGRVFKVTIGKAKDQRKNKAGELVFDENGDPVFGQEIIGTHPWTDANGVTAPVLENVRAKGLALKNKDTAPKSDNPF